MDPNKRSQVSYCGDILHRADISKASAHRESPEDRQPASHRASNASARKVGRPRMPSDVTQAENAKERRRRQIRLAQRAYRSRKMANTQALKDQLAHLQAGIQDISNAAISFSDLLIQSGVLTSHPEITGPLRGLLHNCMGLARDVGTECNQEVTYPDLGEASQPSSPDLDALENPQPFLGEAICPSLFMEPSQTPADSKHRVQFPTDRPGANASDSGEVGMSSFTQHLRLACLNNALALLKDSSATVDDLRRPFRLLLSLLTRDTIISIFEASLSARLHGQELEKFPELSVFQQHGTSSPCKQKPSHGQVNQPHRGDCTVERRPSHSHSRERQGWEGKWFDIKGLEEYLQEKNVSLCLFPPSGPNISSSPCVINVPSFIGKLAKRAICLGHSPGFESHDVELALHSASMGLAQKD